MHLLKTYGLKVIAINAFQDSFVETRSIPTDRSHIDKSSENKGASRHRQRTKVGYWLARLLMHANINCQRTRARGSHEYVCVNKFTGVICTF